MADEHILGHIDKIKTSGFSFLSFGPPTVEVYSKNVMTETARKAVYNLNEVNDARALLRDLHERKDLRPFFEKNDQAIVKAIESLGETNRKSDEKIIKNAVTNFPSDSVKQAAQNTTGKTFGQLVGQKGRIDEKIQKATQ